MIASAPKIPLLGAVIASGVGLTGLLLATMGYSSALAMFGGGTVATLAWIALNWRECLANNEPAGEADDLESSYLSQRGWQSGGANTTA